MNHFLLGVAGAFTAYFALYRESRFREFFENPRQHWRIFLFDMIFFLVSGGLVASFLIEPRNNKEAFMAGICWQGLVGGVVAGNELKESQDSKSLGKPKGGKTK